MTTSILAPFAYEARGSVRGSCGHRHRSPAAAAACAAKDHRDCARLGGGAYSDRIVLAIIRTGRA